MRSAVNQILEGFGKLVPFLPEKYRKWLLIAIGIASVVSFNLLLEDAGQPSNFYPATALLDNQTDIVHRLPKSGGNALITSRFTSEEAPLMTWENTDIRNGLSQRWYIDPLVSPVAREIFNELLGELSRQFPNNIKPVITRDPSAPYKFQQSTLPLYPAFCGLGDGAVGCAIYGGTQSGTVAYNGSYPGGFSRETLKVILAHELQHLVLNLDHNNCGYSPASVMTPVVLQAGTSCSQPPATGLEPNDWPKAITYYNLNSSPPSASPFPTPSPSTNPPPSPPPSPSPSPFAEGKPVTINVQRWTYVAATNTFNVVTIHLTKELIKEPTWYTVVVNDQFIPADTTPFILVSP